MTKNRRSAVATSDGFLDLPANPDIAFDEEHGAPALHGHMVITEVGHDVNVALAQQLYQERVHMLIGKSGSSRIGLEVLPDDDPHFAESEFNFRTGRIVVPVKVLSLRAVEVRQNGVRDDLLRVLEDMTRERAVNIGRLVLARPSDQLDRDEVLRAFAQHQIAIGPGLAPEECVQADGTLELPLERLHYVLCEANLRTEEKRRVLRYGKHGLSGLQEEREGLPEHIHGKAFFVGGIRISLGAFIAIIDQQTSAPGLTHLAARALDGIQTTGLDVARQVELFNRSYEDIASEEVRMRIRLYHANKDAQRFANRVVNARTLARGVSLTDVLELERHPERIVEMMRAVSPSVSEGDPAGYFVGAGKALKVSWVDNAGAAFQNAHLRMAAPKFAAGDREYVAHPDRITLQPAHELTKRLGFVGQEQSHRNLYFQWGYPDTAVMANMHENGVGVFVAHDVRMSPQTFADEPYFTNRLDRTVTVANSRRPEQAIVRHPVNETFFTDKEFNALQKLHGEGARFLLVRHKTSDAFGETPVIPERVMEWHERGFWVQSKDREAVEAVDTVIAMYGSHVKGMDAVFEPQVARFSLRMQQVFGESAGFIHGKGPGIMYITDKVARHLSRYAPVEDAENVKPMVSMGVGIDLEQSDQAINEHPQAQVDFGAQHRLVRQKHMNDRSVFNVFNLGGAGTLEEIALSLCSQKLYKNILTPLIFVDPEGVSAEGHNFWLKLQMFIEDMSTRKEISMEAAENGILQVQFLQGHMKNFMHVVDSYDAAADIIEKFTHDPVGYYVKAGVTLKEFEMAFAGATEVRRDTKFPMPKWIAGEVYARMLEDSRWQAAQ